MIRKWLRTRRRILLITTLFYLLTNVYILSLHSTSTFLYDILYGDALILMVLSLLAVYDYVHWKHRYEAIQEIRTIDTYLLYEDIPISMDDELSQIWKQNEQKYLDQCSSLQQQHSDLQDMIIRWVHEFKLPLSALKMQLERIEDDELKQTMRFQIEKMSSQANNLLYGCKCENADSDMEIKKVSLQTIVYEAVKNNAYFLIHKNFDMQLHDLDVEVYTDTKWLVYILDQLLSNALKYERVPRIEIYAVQQNHQTCLCIKDYGIGIKKHDLPHIFDKGYVGENGRNQQYKASGMGLYFVKRVASFLSIELEVVSTIGEYSEFKLTFKDMADYFNLS